MRSWFVVSEWEVGGGGSQQYPGSNAAMRWGSKKNEIEENAPNWHSYGCARKRTVRVSNSNRVALELFAASEIYYIVGID